MNGLQIDGKTFGGYLNISVDFFFVLWFCRCIVKYLLAIRVEKKKIDR